MRSFITWPLVLLSYNMVFAGPTFEISSETELKTYITKNQFSGTLAVLQGHRFLFKESYGHKNLDSKEPIQWTDKFQIGSVTKQFIAAAILKLQDQNKLDLDDPVSTYLPQHLQFKNITVREILNHTSGLMNYSDNLDFWKIKKSSDFFDLDEIINFAARFPLEFDPTTKWKYTNTGYILAGRIIELLSGQSWHEFVRENFLRPLNMMNTGYEPQFEKVSPIVGYIENNGTSVPINAFNLSCFAPAGGLYSNADDLIKWFAIYEKSSLLSEFARNEMQKPFLNNYGLGVLMTPFEGEWLISHGGRTPGFTSELMYLNKSNLKVVKLSNREARLPNVANILLDFYTKGRSVVLKTDSYEISEQSYDDFIGTYVLKNMELKVFVSDHKLYLHPNDGQPPYPLKSVDKDSFTLLDMVGLEFVRNENHLVKNLVVFQNGQFSTALKASKSSAECKHSLRKER